jgi:hypothetical protein
MITSSLLTAIREEINEALAAVAARHNVTIAAGRATYTQTNSTMKLEISAKDAATGEAIPRMVSDFKNLAYLHGLKPEDLGRKFVFSGRGYTIMGLKPRCTKRPIIVKRDDGREFKIDASLCKQ